MRDKAKRARQNPIRTAMLKRYGMQITTHRDRRERRAKDARAKREPFGEG